MALTIDGTNGIETNTDTGKLKLGTDDDLSIYHDGSNSRIHSSSHNLYVRTGGQFGVYNGDGTEGILKGIQNGAVELYYDSKKCLSTRTDGISIENDDTETWRFTGHILSGVSDSAKLYLGAGDDIRIYHDGSNSYIHNENTSGHIYIQGDSIQLRSRTDTETYITAGHNGAVELYYDNVKILYTYSEGIKVSGFVKAQRDVSDSHWGDNYHDWSHFHQDDNSQSIVVFESSANSTPYGIEVSFTDAQPDNNSQNFFAAYDHNGTDFTARAKIMSDGDVWTSDSGYLTSDQTLKENITDATPKLEDLKKLKVRNFNWKSDYFPQKSKTKQIGFVAQEVEQVFPALVSEHDIAPGTGEEHTPIMKKAIKQAWSPIIIKAMQELIAKVETLETEVAALKAK